MLHEGFEKGERRENLEKWGNEQTEEKSGWETPDVAPAGAAEYVGSVLDGIDADAGFVGDEQEDEEGDATAGTTESGDANSVQADAPLSSSAQAPTQAAGVEPAADEPAKDSTEEAGGELPELAYWPSLVKKDGEFDAAAKQLYRMKQVAYAFQKQQVEAKKKAIEQWKAMMSAEEYSAAKKKYADEHQKSAQPGIDEQKAAAVAANASAGHLGNAAKKQDDSKSHANGEAPKAPDPGSKPSRLHPIRRIWWYVKRWASKAAATVFGFIQEKIGSIIMRMLCGVSMDDMKKYTLALHRRSEWSALIVGGKTKEEAAKAMTSSGDTAKKAQTAAEEALGDAQECDQNMVDATGFLQNIETTEKDLVEEQQRASQFIASLRAAVAAEREHKQAEQLKQASSQKASEGAASAAAAAPATKAKPPASPKKREMAEKKKKPVSAAAISKVKSAAEYVSKQASIVTQQLLASRQSQSIQLSEKLEKAGAKDSVVGGAPQIAGKLGARIVDQMKTTADEISSAATESSQKTMTNNSELQSTASDIRSQAKTLDEVSTAAFQHLNALFRQTYETATHAA